jgi:Predicted membrane protein (DUF2207) C-terminal domain/Predicted membrane protein (DUF2207) N-terminal domain
MNRSYGKGRFRASLWTALVCAVLLLALTCAATVAQEAGERILSFSSRIVVNADSTMLVTETIKVRSVGEQIKRGIYRDFPTRYRDRYGNNYVVGFDVRDVRRDDIEDGYHTENLSNGVRVYIGREDYFLPPGEYTYTLTYQTDRQLGFFKDHDELYWNVTGNGWVFPIDHTEATVIPPPGVPHDGITTDGYTGPKGAKQKDFTSVVNTDGSVSFASSKVLGAYEGLTIVVGWPKGFVKEPPIEKKVRHFLSDNVIPITGAGGLIVLLIYYVSVWSAVGRDPEEGTIMALYEPPDNLSPAAMRYITKMGYDNEAFAATVVNMAVKGYLTIEEEGGQYTLRKKAGSNVTISKDEQQVASKLFGSGTEIVLEKKNHAAIRAAREALQTSLASAYEKNYFVKNSGRFVIGVLISLAVLALVLFSARHAGDALFLTIWLTGWSIGVVALLFAVVTLWKAVFTGWGQAAARKGALGAAIFMTLFSLPFFGGEFLGLYGLAQASPVLVVLLGALVFVNILFYHLLKAPTLLGRRVLDRIEGFKTFLAATEEDRFGRLYPVERTPALFERYLPYALALDVEQPWTEQFSDIIGGAAVPEGGGYHPGWYSGSSWDSSRLGTFAGSIGGSLAGAISSSSTAPGSSSGGGGGGSSGGGGGGGGGGGW